METPKTALLGRTLDEIQQIVRNLGMPKFAAKQITSWLYDKKVETIDEMTNLSLKHREALKEGYEVGASAPVEEMRKAFERRRDLIVKLAKEVPGLEVNMPQGAFYLFPKCNSYFGKSNGEKTINNSTDFAMYLLEEAHVATVGGDAFGDPDCFRMSYATSDENIVEAIKRIKEALGKLK